MSSELREKLKEALQKLSTIDGDNARAVEDIIRTVLRESDRNPPNLVQK